jgi:hypothetical protein
MNDLPGTIDDVLNELDKIITQTIQDNNYLGIFAYVYRRTTAEIKKAILEKQFDDNERMERMDVTFANKYISAYRNFKNAERPVSLAWMVSFRSEREKLTIMQHLLMGMNAHINLDLGIAAAETAPGTAIQGLKTDFMKVNDILAGLTQEMQVRVGKISWWMFLLDWLGERKDESVINFSMAKARQAAWVFACSLAPLSGEDRNRIIAEVDAGIASLAEIIRRPPGLLMITMLKFISEFEEKNVRKIVEGLGNG